LTASVDVKSFWQTLGERATGLTLVTARGAAGPAGFIGLSAAHVCAEPPTILVSIDDKTSALAAVMESKHFAVNYLPASAQDLVAIFSGKGGIQGADRFSPDRWQTLTTGAPIYKEALGAFDCVVETLQRVGSTNIVIGSVVDLLSKGAGDPLVFFRGKVRTLSS